MKFSHFAIAGLLLLTACNRDQSRVAPDPIDGKRVIFSSARERFETRLIREESENQPVPEPPATELQTVQYSSDVGSLSAYLSPPPNDGKKHPAIIWVFGGFGNSIDETAWTPAPPDNDQSAIAFRQAGIITMYPSFRGGNENPGFKEGLYGEVNDVLAAAKFLREQEYVDPDRIYLGGHSTGGTLVLLTAAASFDFRAVFSFGPVDDVANYGSDSLPFDTTDERERAMRAPILWLDSIISPTFVFEGTEQGNLEALEALSDANQNPQLHFYPIQEQNHFSILSSITPLIADKILEDTGSISSISWTQSELDKIFQ